jgi:hypothetical protein
MSKPNPNATSGVYYGFDGWTYGGAGIDTTQYKYAAILYKFDAANEHEDFRTVFKVLRGGFTKGQNFTTDQPLKYGKWDIVTFDMTGSAEFVDKTNPNITQVHLLPFQEGKIKELDDGWLEYTTFFTVPDYYVPSTDDVFSLYSSPVGELGIGFLAKDITVERIL